MVTFSVGPIAVQGKRNTTAPPKGPVAETFVGFVVRPIAIIETIATTDKRFLILSTLKIIPLNIKLVR